MELTIFWLILFILLVVIEIATMGLTTIWFAAGALVATIASVFGANIVVQSILFLLISILMLIFTRPVAVKYFNKDRTKTNVESLIGEQAVVISDIDNLQGIGQALVGGQEWTARCEMEDGKIKTGSVVEIVAVQGVKLIVREKTQD